MSTCIYVVNGVGNTLICLAVPQILLNQHRGYRISRTKISKMVLGYMLVSKLAVMAVIRAIVLSTQQSDTPLQELTPLVQAAIGYNRPGGFNENIRFLLYSEKR